MTRASFIMRSKSRCLEVCFDAGLFEAAVVIKRPPPRQPHAKGHLLLVARPTFQRLREIMHSKFSDLLAVANALEFEVGITS